MTGSPSRRTRPVGVEPLWKQLAARGTASPKLWMDLIPTAEALSRMAGKEFFLDAAGRR